MYMEGFAKFLVIFVQRYFYPCLNKIGTKKQKTKTKQNKTKKQTNKHTKRPFWQFLKNTISNQKSCEIPFLKMYIFVYFTLLVFK